LRNKGYRGIPVNPIPVNPGVGGEPLLGEGAYTSLRDIPEPVVNGGIIRNSPPEPPPGRRTNERPPPGWPRMLIRPSTQA
jgi:hypothetical protein